MEKHTKVWMRTLGVVLWPSFLVASIGTMVFFACFDPRDLVQVATWPMALDRRWGYSLGFFLFWMLTLMASGLTAYLLES